MTDNKEEGRREALKLYFEFFKHLTTLNTAAALVMLAIFREMEAPLVSTLTAVILLGLSLLVSLLGMAVVVRSVERAEERSAHRCLRLALLLFAFVYFAIALWAFWPSASS